MHRLVTNLGQGGRMPWPKTPSSPFHFFNPSAEIIRPVALFYVRFPVTAIQLATCRTAVISDSPKRALLESTPELPPCWSSLRSGASTVPVCCRQVEGGRLCWQAQPVIPAYRNGKTGRLSPQVGPEQGCIAVHLRSRLRIGSET